jgi:Coenzyme PQQ synthesis protein D (PqqD)
MNQVASILNQKLSVPENVLAQELNGEIVILNMDSETYYSLNSVGSRIWQSLTNSENVETAMQQLLQVYLVDETALLRDVTEFVKELSKEELLISYDSQELEGDSLLKQTISLSKKKIDERDLATTEEVNNYHQSEADKAKNIENFLDYEAPLLRKHGKVNDVTEATLLLGTRFDNFFRLPNRAIS